MVLSRRFALRIHFILDQLLPPILRDLPLMRPVFKFLYGKQSDIFLDFKSHAPGMSTEGFAAVYREINNSVFERETDLNRQCIDEILKNMVGETVLEVGFGNGYLLRKIAASYKVTAADVYYPAQITSELPHVTFVRANIEELPFPEQSFDTVICAHVLEHVQRIPEALSELRRVAKKKLIIVVPRQRPYRYTFDLHLHFFPYEHSLLALTGKTEKNECRTIGGDLFYVENR
jgi:ubiquinone/menaquinone biosynthesis C-methylase UbiE